MSRIDTTLTFARHSEIDLAVNGDDLERPLSGNGLNIAHRHRTRVNRAGHPIGLVLSSYAHCAVQTANILTDVRPVIQTDALHLPRRIEEWNSMRKQLTGAPLAEYLTENRTVLDELADDAERFIRAMATEHQQEETLVVGHDVLLQNVARRFTDDDRVSRVSLAPCTGFIIFPGGMMVLQDTVIEPYR